MNPANEPLQQRLAPYEIDAEHCKLVGRGAFGTVYRYCKFPARRIALKLVDYDKKLSDAANKKFIEYEARLGKTMGQAQVGPGVFTVQFDDENKTALIAMEFMDMDLQTFFQKNEIVSEAALEDLSQRLTRVLDRMARVGYKCLDLKPSNVMVNVDKVGNIDRVRIIDFDTKYCTQDTSYHKDPAAPILAMQTMLAANAYKMRKTLLFVDEMANLDDAEMDRMLEKDKDGKDSLFFKLARHYLKCIDSAMGERECIKGKLREIAGDAKRFAQPVSSPSKRKR